MSLSRLIYYSQTADSDSPIAIQDILTSARQHNEKNAITGALMFNHTYFLQALEGLTESVSETFLRVADDPRHIKIVLVGMKDIDNRAFGTWSMKYISDVNAYHHLFLKHSTHAEFNPSHMTFQQLDNLMIDINMLSQTT